MHHEFGARKYRGIFFLRVHKLMQTPVALSESSHVCHYLKKAVKECDRTFKSLHEFLKPPEFLESSMRYHIRKLDLHNAIQCNTSCDLSRKV